ncbi:MAG: O-antigen ligase family protein [Candidatus Pacebacteria bacterium]|nr:O-antigen ligase family protein [Candidatus Paceibacterota bacterium]
MKDIARYITLGALFLIPFIPLYVANSLFFPFITGKGFLFRILVEAALAGYVLLAFADARYRPRFSWILASYAAFAAWLFIADLFGENPMKAVWSNYERMDGFVTLIHVFAFFVVAATVLAADGLWRRWWLTFLAASGLVTLYSLMQVACAPDGCTLGGGPAFVINQGGVRVDGTLGNAAYLAGYMLFAIGIALLQAIESRGFLRYALATLAALSAVVLFYTATRSALLALVAAASFGVVLGVIALRGTARRYTLIALALVILLIGGFIALRDTELVRSDPTLARLASLSLADGATRFTIWGVAWEGVKERPVLGWGQEGFNHVFNRWYEPKLYYQEPWFDRAHNIYIDWLVAGGFPALFLFLGILGASAWYLYRSRSFTVPERVMFASIIAAYAVNALFIFDNLWSYVPLAAVLAYLHAKAGKPVAKIDALPKLAEPGLTTIATPVVLVTTLVLMWWVNVPSILAAGRLVAGISSQDVLRGVALVREADSIGGFGSQEIAEQAVAYAGMVVASPGVPAGIKQEAGALSVELMEKAILRQPADARLRIQFASAYRAAGDYASAMREMETAIALSPKKQATYLQAGVLEWERGEKARALNYFEQAYGIDTRFEEIAAYVAAGHIITGNRAEADSILAEAFGTKDIDRAILLYAFATEGLHMDVVRIWQMRAKEGGANEQYQLALAYKAAGNRNDARATAEAAMKTYPETAPLGVQVLAEINKP